MVAYLARHAVQLVIAVFGISVIVFCIGFVIGDPINVLVAPDASVEDREIFRRAMGLDQPVPVQYARFLAGAIRLDFGDSFRIKKPAIELVLERMPATLQLTFAGIALALVVSIPLGVLAAYYRNSWIDAVSTLIAVASQAMPIYWLGLMMIIVFGVQLKWLPPSGYGSWQHAVMPTICLGLFLAPVIMRLLRSSLIEVLSLDYIRTARAKGLTDRKVIIAHALRNATAPTLAVLGLQFGQLLGGAIITETVFAWPGVATLAVGAIRNADFPVTQASVIVIALLVCIVNLLTDLAVAALDPRVRVD